ncbi:MAG: DUF2723 domain-containing protein [Candidatus Omnitrophota bacterium]
MLKTLFNRRNVIILALFIFSFAMRFVLLSKGPFHLDALDLAVSAQKTLNTHMLHYEHGTGYPLTVICAAFMMLFFKLFGITDPVFCVNFMSCLFGSVSVVLLFFLVEKLFDPSAQASFHEAQGFCGLTGSSSSEISRDRLKGSGVAFRRAFFSALLLSCFAPHLAVSTFGKSLTVSICLSLASAFCMVVYTLENKNRYLVYSAVFLGFCAAARLSDVLVGLPILFLYFSAGKMEYRRLKGFVVFVVISALTGLIYYVPMFLDRGLGQFVYVWRHGNEAGFMGIFSFVFKYNLIWMVKIFGFAGLILCIAGFTRMIVRKHYRQVVFLFGWFLLLFVFYAGISSCGPRYLVIAWIPLLVAQGYFLGGFRGRKNLAVCVLVLLICSVGFVKYVPVLAFRHFYSLQEEFARWVGEKTPSDAVIVAMDESAFIHYYGKRRLLRRPVFENQLQVEDFLKQLDDLLAQDRSIYMIDTALEVYDEARLFKKSLFENYSVLFIGSKVNEDWHHSLLKPVFFKEKLFKIEKRQE